MRAVAVVVVPKSADMVCPDVRVFAAKNVIVPAVVEATKYDGVILAPFTFMFTPKNEASVLHTALLTVPAKGATAVGEYADPVVLAVQVVVVPV